MLYLLESDTRNVKWNGIPLHEATSAIIKEQMNGDFTLTVRYPITDSEIYQLFREDMLIKAPAPVIGPQLFRIKKPVENDDHLEITAYHITDDIMQRFINPLSVNKQSCWQALSQLVQVAKSPINDFSFTSDITDRRTINTKEVETLYSVLMDGAHSIVGTWEGEMVRDNFAISIKRNRGEDRGVIISTHKNLKSYQRTKNSQNVVTRIHAKSTFKAEGAKEDTTIAITVDSPLISAYPYINERSYTNNNIQTVEELTKWASAKFTNEHIDKATDAIKIEAYELDGQTVHMGDTVNLKSYKHNVDVYKKAIAYEYDCLANNGQGAYLTITFDDKVKSGGNGGGVSAVANAILDKQETKFDIMLERAIANADRAFDAEFAKREKDITDAIELAKAKAEEVKQELSDTINQRFDSFDNGPLKEAKRKAEEALRNAGASSLLAQEAKRIGLDSIAKLEAFKSQTTSAQTALSGVLDALKQTVTSEVNQASEYRRTTTEALSRMTGQMNGFATKSEVKQDIDGLTQTFAKMKVGGRNYAEDYDFSRGLWHYSQGDNSPQDWTISNGEYNVKGTTKTWKQIQIHSKEGGRASGKNSTALLELEIGETYTLSFQGICYSGSSSVWLSLRANRTVSGNPEIMSGTFNLTSSWQTYQVTIPALTKPENFDFWRIILGYNEIGHVAFRKVELTRSSTRIDAGPAPEDGKADLVVAKSEFQKTAEGLSAKMTAVERYVNQDGQRQEALQRYAREESAKQATAVREQISKDYVGKNTFQESVQGVERRLESLSLGTSGNLLKNSNEGFYNQHDKRYRLVETLQANQVYTLVTKYWHGENSTDHTFYDGVGKWQRLSYNKAIDAWMVQFTPTQEIPAGTEIVLSAVPNEAKGNMSWATLVRGAIPLIHWQPAKGDVEEGVTQKLAEYKETVDGRFATISRQINGKANQSDFQRVKETSQLYERILGGSGSSDQTVKDNVARLVMTNQLFQTEVGRYSGNGVNRAINTTLGWGPFITRSGNDGVNLHADLHKILSSGFKAGDTVHVRMEISIDDVQRFNDKQIVAILQSYGDVTNWARAGRTFDYNIGTLQPGNNWRLIEFDTVMTEEMLRNNSWMLNLRIDGASSYKVHTKAVKVEKGNVASAWSPAPEDTEEAIRTVQTQLDGSWAVQNINSAGDIISGINLGATGHNRITGKLTHITGDTLIDNAVIKSAMIDKLKTANFEAGSVTTTILDAEAVTADKVKMNEAFANKLVASDTFTDTLTAKRGFINQLVSNAIFTNVLTAQRGFIQKLVSNNIFTNELTAQRSFINQLQSKIINTEVLDAFRGRIGGFNIGPFPQGGGRWITGNNPHLCGMGNGEGGGIRTAFWANWGSNWNQAGWGSWVVTTDGKMSCKNDVSFYHRADFSNTCTVNFYSQPTFSKGAVINGSLNVSGRIAYNGGEWIYSPRYKQLRKATSQGSDWLYLDIQGNNGSDWIHMNKEISDRRYKSNIQDSQVSGLNVIEKLKTYSYRKEYDGKIEDISCGIMAQDVQKYAPEAFFENPDGAYSYRTFELVPYLIKAIQELNQKIEKMEKTIA